MSQLADPQRRKLFKLKGQKLPEYWEYARLVVKPESADKERKDLCSVDAFAGYCFLCGEDFVFRVGKSEIVKHMDRNHRMVIEETRAKREANEMPLSKPKRPKHAQSTPFDQHPQQEREPTNATIDQQKKLNWLIAVSIARSLRPILIVEDEDFADVVRYIAAEKMVLSRERRCATRLSTWQQHLIGFAWRLLKYSLTSDIWTDRGMRGYDSLTLHYVDEHSHLNIWVLEVAPFKGRHTSARIVSAIENILKKWRNDDSRCVRFVGDGAANTILATTLLGLPSMSCVAYEIHLVVGALLMKPLPKAKPTQVLKSLRSTLPTTICRAPRSRMQPCCQVTSRGWTLKLTIRPTRMTPHMLMILRCLMTIRQYHNYERTQKRPSRSS